jgi:L-seryl-tRNA(Ser) seleniumtransferase
VADFRVLPSIDALLQRAGVAALESRFGPEATRDALRRATARIRETISTGQGPASSEAAAEHIEREATTALAAQARGSLRPVINATGVVIHTNMGRAPIPAAALERLTDVARGYSNLEYDLARGERGSRHTHAEALLTELTGAESAIVVNNNAAATLLILAGLAQGREVIISRGELVEIGGGFRVPDVLRQSGALLREVGTTNRTRVSDYVAAIGTTTAMILRVHPSNFRIEGFTERPGLDDLVTAGHAMSIPVIEDLGSGCLWALSDEPTVQASIAAGVDVVCFSGDKLLGGPQAGIIAGKQSLIDRLRTHPLMRALRVDKLTLAVLEATLSEYIAGRAHDSVPVRRMLQADADAIEQRAQAMAEKLTDGGWKVALVSGSSAVGGGSAPGLSLPTVLLAVEKAGYSAERLEAHLRSLDPPVIARIDSDRVILDLRTVLDDDVLLRLLVGDPF